MSRRAQQGAVRGADDQPGVACGGLRGELADDGARPEERHLDLAQQRAHLAAADDPKGARPLALPLQRLAEVRVQWVLAYSPLYLPYISPISPL